MPWPPTCRPATAAPKPRLRLRTSPPCWPAPTIFTERAWLSPHTTTPCSPAWPPCSARRTRSCGPTRTTPARSPAWSTASCARWPSALPAPRRTPAPGTPDPTPHPNPRHPRPSPSLWDLAVTATSLRARLAAEAPPGLLEAVAALQDLAVRQAPAGERAQRIAALEDLQRALPPAIMTAKNGPYLVTNVPRSARRSARRSRCLLSWPCAGAAPRRSSRSATGRTPATGSPTPRTPTGCPTSATPTQASRSRSSTTGASASTPACAPTGWPPCSARTRSRSSPRAAAGWTRSSGRCATARPGR